MLQCKFCNGEILTDGKEPYEGLSAVEAGCKILYREKLEIPEDTPEMLKQVMSSCWKFNPDLRPHFQDIYAQLEVLKDSL